MGFQITGQNNQFATASGLNLDVQPGSSRFDGAPSTTTDLIITTKDADPDPRLFEVGDTYDLSFRDSLGVQHTILNASVSRSDSAGAGGVIVFQGQDQFGSTYHLVWSPDFDLEGWYNANFDPLAIPEFFTTDQNAAYTHSFICFAGSTRISTPGGWVKAGKLEPGMQVSTWNGPPRTVLWIGRRRVAAHGPSAPVHFAIGSIGNTQALRLSQQHRVMIRVPRNASEFGVTELLVPAKELVDGQEVTLRRGGEITYVHCLLDRHDLLIAEGAPCESLMPGPEARVLLRTAQDRAGFLEAVSNRAYHPVRPLLSGKAARRAGRLRIPLREKQGLSAL